MDAKPGRTAPQQQAPERDPADLDTDGGAPERFGELELRRLRKGDGRQLIVYSRGRDDR